MSIDEKISKVKKYTIIGAGVSGKSIAHLARACGADVFVSEKGPIKEDTRQFLRRLGATFEEGGNTTEALEADSLVLSSGVPPTAEIVEKARLRKIPVIGELDFVARHIKGRVIGVTGSNGKTTTTALAGHILAHAGYETTVAGNIGTPLAECAFREYDWIVAELSSFQLYWAREFKIDIPIVTNIAPDHLDWHGNLNDYIAAKIKIFSLARGKSAGICQERDVKRIREITGIADFKLFPLKKGTLNAAQTESGILLTEEACYLLRENRRIPLFSVDDIPLVGSHNRENAAMASAAAVLAGIDNMEIAKSLKTFVPLPHRCEKVAEIGGITYVDDSKGTNVAATVTALSSIKGPLVVILGGKGKGEEYGPLAEAVARYTVASILMGKEKDRIAKALQKIGYESFCKVDTMEEAVESATKRASPGTTVILSPACTSWDMYENYKARGEHFKQIVRSMDGGSS